MLIPRTWMWKLRRNLLLQWRIFCKYSITNKCDVFQTSLWVQDVISKHIQIKNKVLTLEMYRIYEEARNILNLQSTAADSPTLPTVYQSPVSTAPTGNWPVFTCAWSELDVGVLRAVIGLTEAIFNWLHKAGFYIWYVNCVKVGQPPASVI